MQKLSKKRLLKHRTMALLVDLLKSLLSDEEATKVTPKEAYRQLGKKSYYRCQLTGSIKLGLCYKQVRQEVKNNPYITLGMLKKKHNFG